MTQSRQQLYEHARALGLRNISRLRKHELQALLDDDDDETTVFDTFVRDYASRLLNGEEFDIVNSNFSNVAKVYGTGVEKYRFKACDIHIDHLIRKLTSGASGAKTYAAYVARITSDVSVKIWGINENLAQNKCLSAEWLIHTFIVPFLFYTRLTPCVLIPFQSGACSVQVLTPALRDRASLVADNRRLRYIVSPYIESSLGDYLDKRRGEENPYIHSIFVQVVYTIAALASVGLRHNDLHLSNIRIGTQGRKKYKFAFRLPTGRMLYHATPRVPVILDFDRMGVDTRWGPQLRNACTMTGHGVCADYNQCDTDLGGRRDLLMVATQMFNDLPLPLREYVRTHILMGTRARDARFREHMSMDNDYCEIDWSDSNYHDFVSVELTDKDAIRLYPGAEDILTDPEFLDIILSDQRFVFDHVPRGDSKDAYTVYSYRNGFSPEKYIDFAQKYYELV